MKTENNTPYLEATKLLYIAFEYFNKQLCNGELKTPVIYVGTRGRKRALGWWGKDFWRDGDKNSIGEINICAERLDRGFDEVMETLIHELVHADNSQKGIKDCAGNTQWHNKHFKSKAEQFGLIVTKIKGKGYAETKLGAKAKELIKSLPFTEKEWPSIKRLEKRGGGLGSGKNTFIICSKADKAKFIELCNGMKQTDFVGELLNVYENQQAMAV